MTGDRQTENAASEGTCASPCSEIVPWGYALFEHMEKEHGLILVESEINDIISVVKSIIDQNDQVTGERSESELTCLLCDGGLT